MAEAVPRAKPARVSVFFVTCSIEALTSLIDDAAVHPPNDAIYGLSGNYLDGVATIGARIVLILNIRELVDALPTAAA